MKKPRYIVMALILVACCARNNAELASRIQSLDLQRGEVTLCGGGDGRLGVVSFASGCSAESQDDFNLAAALLHSFEYPEAEKIFARVIEKDPRCVMAYWGAAMSIFHPLWERPMPDELAKGAEIIALGREVSKDVSHERANDYLESIATIYDDWKTLSHQERVAKFEAATQAVHEKYPDDSEASIFYALALRAAADPTDKSYVRQKSAGEILEALEKELPNHPGIAHYIIHVYDYPELAARGLAAARSYASIAAASAHAQHMPSHIFTRLGLWDEAIQSNVNSISSAQCYAEAEGIKGHWDEELHSMDYLVYAHLQRGDDRSAAAQMTNLATINEIYPYSFKVAYSVAAMPARYAVERKDWDAAARLELPSLPIDWEKWPWEKSNYTFARLLGDVHTNQLAKAKEELGVLKSALAFLQDAKDGYKSNLVLIQLKASEGWISLAEGKKSDAIRLMTEAADLEDRTEKHSVTPGEILPARELLGDMYMELGQPEKALEAYRANLVRHPNRFNALQGAALACEGAGLKKEAGEYYAQLLAISDPNSERAARIKARTYISGI